MMVLQDSVSRCPLIDLMSRKIPYNWPDMALMWPAFLSNLSMKYPRLLTQSDGMTDTWPILMLMLVIFANCCLVPKIINSVLLSLGFNLLKPIHAHTSSIQFSSADMHLSCGHVFPFIGLNVR